jgi:hypothetical protein
MRKILLLLFIILISGVVFANDFYVSDIIVPKTVVEDTNFDINIIIVNTFSIEKDVNLRVQIYTPDAHLLWDRNYRTDLGNEISINANDFNNLQIPITIVDTNASTAQHLIRTTIGTNDVNPINNIAQQWFVIRKVQKRTPIPDMPIYFGFIIAIVVAVFIINKDDKK